MCECDVETCLKRIGGRKGEEELFEKKEVLEKNRRALQSDHQNVSEF